MRAAAAKLYLVAFMSSSYTAAPKASEGFLNRLRGSAVQLPLNLLMKLNLLLGVVSDYALFCLVVSDNWLVRDEQTIQA
jgi:hypothetical protein